ncbi:MAG TPA: LLM class F420-dependent oxidoreductase [Amycolatopsis sp.]|nr:LLM class F420-dependent oxidoreductase [Amycolatopsis sp.]
MVNALGKLGIWRPATLIDGDLAREVEKLGYGAIWLGGSPDAGLEIVDELLDTTEHIVVATGIVNMWKADAPAVGESYHRIVARHPGRFLLGVGIGHPEATSVYRKPYDKIVEYLDQLDEAGVPVADRALAALGRKVLKVSAERTAGAHPYLTTPEHTRQAREVLGKGALLVPEQTLVLSTDPGEARRTGHNFVKRYLGLRNYVGNLKRLGWSDEDVAGEGSDALVDALVPHGNAETIFAATQAHLDAGADQVCIQVLGKDPLPGYRAVAQVLLS